MDGVSLDTGGSGSLIGAVFLSLSIVVVLSIVVSCDTVLVGCWGGDMDTSTVVLFI